MKNQLSNQEIQRLFIAVQKKGVKYIDVQHEIVDHLASEIEFTKETHPKLNFQQQMDLAFRKFPTDIKMLVRTKEKSMNRYWQRRTMSYIKSYFQLPTINFTLLLYLMIVIGTFLFGKYVLVTVLGFLLIAVAYTFVKLYTSTDYSRMREKNYLVLRMFFGQTTTLLILPTLLLNIFPAFKPEDGNLIDQNWYIYIASGLVVFTLMWCHACLTAFPKMLKEELKVKYPYLNFAN